MAKAWILIVEEDRFHIELYRDILEREGYKVEVARSAEEARRQLGSGEPFDLVIADAAVKGASELELLQELKRSFPGRDVIMVTGAQSVRKAVEALKLGACDCLTKPVDKDELLLAVKKSLERQIVSQEHTRLISENIHFYELLRIQKKNLSLLSIIDAEKLQDAILDTLIQELQAPGGTLFIRDAATGGYALAASRGLFEAGEAEPALAFRTRALGDSLEAGKVILESTGGDQWIPRAGEEGARMILPLRHLRDTLGAVRLARRHGGKPYGPFDIDLGRHILEAAGMSLHNAFRIRRLLESGIHAKPSGTYSPAYFHAFAGIQLNVSGRYNRDAALLLLTLANYRDIHDRFKDVQVEDAVERLSRHVLEVIRETDILARLGDDLFGIIVPETDYYGALMLKKRIKNRLSKVRYPLDEKREIAPVVHLGCASSPRDGTHIRELMEAAASRLDEERLGICGKLHLEREDFWGMVKLMLDPSIIGSTAASESASAGIICPIRLTAEDYVFLARGLLRDLEIFCASRGLLYLGMGEANPASPLFAGSVPRDSFRMSVFAMGSKADSLWHLPHITPVFVNDPQLSMNRFILAVSEHFSYALFCRVDGEGEGGDTLRGFHTGDHGIVLALISRLQERYLLQRRIG